MKSLLLTALLGFSFATFATPRQKCDAVYAQAKQQYDLDVLSAQRAFHHRSKEALEEREALFAQAEYDRKEAIAKADAEFAAAVEGVTGDQSAGFINEQQRIRMDAIWVATQASEHARSEAQAAYLAEFNSAEAIRLDEIAEAKAKYDRVTSECFNHP